VEAVIALCFFVSDLHGRRERYTKLLDAITRERPSAVFLGGDLLPFGLDPAAGNDEAGFVEGFLAPGMEGIRRTLGAGYPRVFLIFGNDDARCEEPPVLDAARAGLWEYAHGRRIDWLGWNIYGYACIPPSPFRLKDWERYDVSRFVDPGCIPPEEGFRSAPPPDDAPASRTIKEEIEALTRDDDLSHAIMLFHSPPYGTSLDRAALDDRKVDHVSVDVNIGSIAIRRFIEARQPLVTLHGHVHESARLTGRWRDRIGETHCLSAAHDGPELALIRFDPAAPAHAERELV